MIPLTLRIERFGSFVEPQVFTFPDGPGLYFMQGRNEAEPKLGSNGSGKSTVWKALTWCLFGKDPRGLKAGDVANWETPKGAVVSFEFTDDEGYRFTAVRTHSPNSWKLYYGEPNKGDEVDLTKGDTGVLADMLRLEYETWLMTVLMAQGEPYFLDLRADAKAAVFSEVMGLDRWLDRSVYAAEELSSEDKLVGRLERDIAHYDGQLATTSGDEYNELRAGWVEQRNHRLDELAEMHAQGVVVAKALHDTLDLAELATDEMRDRVVQQQSFIDKKMEKLEEYTAAYQRRAEEHATIQERLRAMAEQLDRLKGAKVCPLCGTAGHMANVRADLKASGQALDSEAVLVAKALARTSEDVSIMRDGVQKAQNDAQKALREVDAAQRALSSARTAYEAQERKLDDLEDEAERVGKDVNPYDTLAADAARHRRQLEVERAEVEGWHSSAAVRCAQLGFWVRGFKDVRLQLIAEALDHYAIEANSCAQALGLSGWELIFEVDRETKSGSIKSGFNVFVKSPHNDRQVPWEAWSGGEAQRLRLAAQLGLSNLIRATTGADVALEVWDEPTEGMSDAGIADLLDALADRAKTERRQIWVVDHRVLGYAGWDGVVTVVKGKKGSRFDG